MYSSLLMQIKRVVRKIKTIVIDKHLYEMYFSTYARIVESRLRRYPVIVEDVSRFRGYITITVLGFYRD